MNRVVRFHTCIDEPIKHGKFTLSELGVAGAMTFIGFVFLGAFGCILGGALGFVLAKSYSQLNKQGFINRYIYWHFSSLVGKYPGIPTADKRLFI